MNLPLSSIGYGYHFGNVGERTVPFGIVQPIAHYPDVGNFETDIVEFDTHLSSVRLIKEDYGFQGFRIACFEVPAEVVECISTVEDVLHNNDMSTFEILSRIHDQSHIPGRLRGCSVAG